MSEFRMPSLGADMEAGRLAQWLKRPGDDVKRGDIIAVVDTQKGAIEIEVYEDGVIEELRVPTGAQVPVGTVLALIRSAGEAAAPSTPGEVPVAALPAAPSRPRPRVSPGARRAAEQHHVDLASVAGSGPGGAVTMADVERAAAGPAAVAGPAATPVSGMRAAIAAAMARSKREIPHLYLASTIDVTDALAWLASRNARRPVTARLLPAVLLLRAVARAVAEVKAVNGFWIDSAFRPAAGVHVGCAIALRDGGLVAPAVHDADTKDVDTLMRELTDLVARARQGALRSSELADSTITMTNLGELGVDAAFGIIYPPQVALVAFGRVVERPWVVGGRVEPRSVLTATLSADHRAVDGRRAGQFLAAVERWLRPPEGP